MSEWKKDVRGTNGYAKTVSVYLKSIRMKFLFMAVCVVVMLVVSGVAVTYGPFDIGFWDSYDILYNHIFGHNEDALKEYIVVDVRSPRIVAGVFGGAGLAVCGVVMQSVLKNPLADPYTTGVSSGAAFGATIAISSNLAMTLGQYSTVIMAFGLSLIPTLVIVLMSRFSNASPTTMIMAGIGIMYIFNALSTILMLWAKPDDLARIYQWQVGSLAKADWNGVMIMAIISTAGITAIELSAGKLNVLATGDDSAKSLGVDADKFRVIMLILVGLISASIVSFTGLIGFVGLVTPHIVRMFVGADNRYLIPATALFGGMLLVIADLVGRSVLNPVILPVGVIMSLLGGPMFLWLISRRSGNVW
ncbi:MAG: Fe3+-siderophore ABC transporter permease [Methanomethylophilus alvi]|nr:MAG: Fe3+-siderophore ABC transporter permease [Methanomethylophilus alvi]